MKLTTNELCANGCGQAAQHITAKGKYVCDVHHSKCPAIVKKMFLAKTIIGDDGLSINQRKAIKAAKTKEITVGDDGLNINQRSAQKARKTMLSDVDDNGKNTYHRNQVKAQITLKSQIDEETGLSKFVLMRQRAKNRHIGPFNIDQIIFDKESFEDNKYTKWYFSIIKNAAQEYRKKKEGRYFERHHIIPKSFGGKNGRNIILLTAKEHYICHHLLVKMVSGNEKFKMLCAFTQLSGRMQGNDFVTARDFETKKKELSVIRSEKMKGKGFCYMSKETRQRNLEGRDNSYLRSRVWLKNEITGESKFVMKEDAEEMMNNGWEKGMIVGIWMWNETEKVCKRVCSNEIEMHLENGFVKGRPKRNK